MLVQIAAGLFIFLVVLAAIGWAGIGLLIAAFVMLAILGFSLLMAGPDQVVGFFIAIGILLSIPVLVGRYLNMHRQASGSLSSPPSADLTAPQ